METLIASMTISKREAKVVIFMGEKKTTSKNGVTNF